MVISQLPRAGGNETTKPTSVLNSGPDSVVFVLGRRIEIKFSTVDGSTARPMNIQRRL